MKAFNKVIKLGELGLYMLVRQSRKAAGSLWQIAFKKNNLNQTPIWLSIHLAFKVKNALITPRDDVQGCGK